ncbi:hypothetical protein OF83DRAFT_1167107 [Amylostereum chailletii]|nr:hypothetical protein OF83DRAFT_1167107 [Amylostereum chailletii]
MPSSRPKHLDHSKLDRDARRDSFIDMTSPTTPVFPVDANSSYARPRTSEETFTSLHTQHLVKNRKQDMRVDTYSPSSRNARKPPLPSSPKPHFKRPSSANPSSTSLPRSSPSSSSPQGPYLRAELQTSTKSRSASPVGHIPPTTNYLSAQERADLVRKSRKLTQLLGQTPPPLASMARQCESQPGSKRTALNVPVGYGKHHRGAFSVAEGIGSPTRGWSSHQSPVSPTSPGDTRRYSAPPSPLEIAVFREDVESWQRRGSRTSVGSGRASFIDLSDEEDAGGLPDGHGREHEDEESGSETDAGSYFGEEPSGRRSSPYSPSSPSLSLSMSSQDRAEDERRRKRDRLAKLHRFLGSRVPTDLVIGSFNTDTSLPLPSSPTLETPTTDPKAWRRLRRRSSSAAEMKSRWLDEHDRVKADLDDHEKAINVRRAIKMEKMFGVQPPQTLYRTRNSPVAATPARVVPPERQSSLPAGPSSPTGRNVNQSAYINKGRSTRSHRSSVYSNESTQNLLASVHEEDGTSLRASHHASSVYMQYRHSLNSLNDIIDRDDRESIAEIHQYLTRDEVPPAAPFEAEDTAPSEVPDTSSFNMALPSSPEPEMVSFQARRRRAAKLTNFFGVDYRDLIGDILESIEDDVQEASHCGTLKPEEVQDLLRKLRKLKTKRQGPI